MRALQGSFGKVFGSLMFKIDAFGDCRSCLIGAYEMIPHTALCTLPTPFVSIDIG